MQVISGKNWFKNNIAPYIKKIKSEIALVQSTIGGTYQGQFSTYASFPLASSLLAGDWVTLSQNDGSNLKGMYIVASSSWTFVTGFGSNEATELNWNNSDGGVYVSPALLVPKLSNKADINGSIAYKFIVANASELTDEALSANQFDSTYITNAEAYSVWSSV